jgi:hypothetical protein
LAVSDSLFGKLKGTVLHLATTDCAFHDSTLSVDQHLGAGVAWHAATRPDHCHQRARFAAPDVFGCLLEHPDHA